MQRTFCGALGVCAFLAMLACVSGELRADSFLDKIYTTPDYCQTDSAYGGFPDPNPPYEDHGGVFCGPCSVSNSLMWLDDNGFPNLAANTAVRKYDQHELIETIASAEYTNSYYHDGLNPTRLATGVSSYIHDCGYEYSRFEFQSWRDVPAAFDTGIDRPNLDWARAGIASPTGVVLWSVGWYDYHPSTKSYTREGGHWVTMVGYDDDHLIIHDPSPRTGYDLVNNYVTPTLITDPQVTFPGGNAAGYYLLSGWPINSVGDYAILDGVFVIEMIPANYAPVAVDDPKVEFVEDYRADEDNAIHTYAYNGVLVNDSDVDGDDLSAYQFSAPAHGTVALDSTGWFTYTPDANYHGTDSFTYRAFDGELYSDPATVNLDIVSVNDVPVAVEDTYEVDENGVLHTYVYNGVLENDTDA
ncbi:MAG: cadherin-like domain-containing protein, partial [Pirellulales bacterium]|nr:cadherin-like domain-containing protein [Pirellulales bacterium]